MKYLLILLLFAFSSGETIIFGVVPQQSPMVLQKSWAPLIEHLRKTSGLDIVFRTEKSIPEFEKNLYAGTYHIAYMNPYHYILANKSGYDARLRASEDIIGILLANKDFVLTRESLENKTFLFPSKFAFAATLLTKYEIKKQYQFDIEKNGKILYVNSHDSVYKGVAREIGDVGGGIIRTFDTFEDTQSKERLKIIHKTKPYPSHPIGFASTLDAKAKQKILQAFKTVPKETLQGLELYPLVSTNDKEYDIIRDLADALGL